MSHAWSLSLRCDRPIQGCEITSHASLSVKGQMENTVRANILRDNPHYFDIKWERGLAERMCANDNCDRARTCNPIMWSKSAGTQIVQCIECARSGLNHENSTFCSLHCFRNSWQYHSSKHEKFTANSNKNGNNNNRRDGTMSNSSSTENITDLANIEIPVDDDNNNNASSWIDICHDRTYIPSEMDVGHPLRVTASAISEQTGEILAGPIILQTNPCLEAPEIHPRRKVAAMSGMPNTGGFSFRILSYNILAEIYATKQMYPYVDSWNLAWPFRRTLLYKELSDYHADIICFQEVQADHYEQDLLPTFQSLNFNGFYTQKSRESMGQYGKVDGCAIFWNTLKFSMVESFAVEFNDLARQEAMRHRMDESQTRKHVNALCKDNVAQIVIFETTTRPTSLLCVANTHLYANFFKPEIKLWQSIVLMRQLEQIAAQRDIPMVLCGDFNSEPDSAVYEYIKRGQVSASQLDAFGDNSKILPSFDNIRHNIGFESLMQSTGSEPSFTYFSTQYQTVLDYIWYTPRQLRVTHLLLPPSEENILNAGVGLPCASYPSDHVLLCSDMVILDKKTKSSNYY